MAYPWCGSVSEPQYRDREGAALARTDRSLAVAVLTVNVG